MNEPRSAARGKRRKADRPPPLPAMEQAGGAAEGDDEGGDEAATSTWQNFLCHSLLAIAWLHKKFFS